MADPNTNTNTGAAAAVAEPPPAEFSVKAFREGTIDAKGAPIGKPKPSEPAKEPVVDETPDPEVEGDPDLAAEIDQLEAPKENETPAEKAARTKRLKEAARKGYATRQKNRADRAETEARELRARLEQLERRPAASGDGDHRRASADRPAHPAETASDPNDPEPTLESVTAKHPNDPDPYARWQRELAAWDRRQERREAEAQHQTEQARARATETRARLEQYADHGRSVHRDYDAKLDTLGRLLRGHPADGVIAVALAGIDDPKVGGELLYQVASKLDDLKAAVRGGEASVIRFIGRLERDITAAAAPPKKDAPAAPTVPTAPDPHTPVAAAASAAPVNPAKRAGTELSLRELREYEKTHGGRRS